MLTKERDEYKNKQPNGERNERLVEDEDEIRC
jgi:hypothetical protein